MDLKLELQEINIILVALAAQPYNQVFNLIQKIQTQAQSQIDFEKQKIE